MRKTALVTGGAGFVGRHAIPLLVDRGYLVSSVDPRHDNNNLGFWKNPVKFEDIVRTLDCEFDVVIHLAANIEDVNVRMNGGVQMYQDIALDYEMAKYLEAHPPKEAVVWMTSCAVDYPDDPYAWVKLTGEKFCASLAKRGVPIKILRPYSGYSHTQALSYPFPAIWKRVVDGDCPVTIWGSGQQVRDWVHVNDLARAVVHAIENFPVGQPIPICTGKGTNFFSLASQMIEAAGAKTYVQADTTKAESSPYRVGDPSIAEKYGFKANITLAEGITLALSESIAR